MFFVPAQLRVAYDVPSDTTGANTTIVIIGAYQNPAAQSDLAGFDTALHLPLANLTVLSPLGAPPFDGSPTQMLSAEEQSTDIEWAHAIAPGAKLVLVEAKSGSDADISDAIVYAVDHNLGDVISMSFSEAEGCQGAEFLENQHAAFEKAADLGITLVAASGDSGLIQPDCTGAPVQAVASPASDPLVTAVGGSELTIDPATGAYQSEVAWASSGGGFSKLYRRPVYQAGFNHNRFRGVPDVAWQAGPSHLSPVVVLGHHMGVAGTSVATAEWAGVMAIASQAAGHRLGAANSVLYRAARHNKQSHAFHVLASEHRWDDVTGLGTPDVANLVHWIAAHSGDDQQD